MFEPISFEPKIYSKNGLEAFRLVGSDGSEFYCEGALDCDEKEIYKDPLGRLYIPVITEIGGTAKYYVELDPQVPPIPLVAQGTQKKAVSQLVNASPRPEASLPEGIFVKPEPVEEPPEPEADASQPAPVEHMMSEEAEADASQPAPVEHMMSEEAEADASQPAPVEHMKSEEAASAIHAIFSSKKDEPIAPVESPAGAPARATKKRSLKWPLTIAAIVIVLLAASVAGVYVVKPAAFDGLGSLLSGRTPSPAPAPTGTPTPWPTAFPDAGAPTASILELIDSDSPEIAAFAQAHVNATSAGNPLRQACDLFDYVNGQWKFSSTFPTSRNASEVTAQLEGTSRDYTVLLTALLQSLGIECRVVISYTSGSDIPRYYPEVLAANTSAGYQTAMQQLRLWYGIPSPQGHTDDAGGRWIALSMGEFPGIRPSDATAEYALSDGTISPLR